MISRIKKEDLVSVTSGKDRGKQGVVLQINRKEDKALVKGVAVMTRHVKARRQGDRSGIVKEESFVPMCKLMPICPRCKVACRVGVQESEGAKRIRICHRCKEGF